MSSPRTSRRLASIALATTLVAPLGAIAFAVDNGEADRLRAAFEDFLGRPKPGEPSAVAVTPLGDDYELSIDFDRLAAPLKSVDVDLKLGRHVARLAPKPDGQWAWRSDRFEPVSWAIKGQTGRLALEGWRAEGEFSPALASFTRHTGHADRIVAEQTAPAHGETPRVDVRRVDEGLDLAWSAVPGASGAGVDAKLRQTLRSTTETFAISEGVAAGVPDMTATLKIGPSTTTAELAGLRSAAVLGLWRHLVAHHDKSDLTAGQAEVKARLRDLGPLFERLRQTTAIERVELETPVGFGEIGRVEVGLDAAGATEKGEADLTISLAGLEVHSLFIPAWASRLIPRDLVLHAKASGWDAASALALWLDRADFAAGPLSDADAAAVLKKLLPAGHVVIDFTGNRVKATDWTLDLDGGLVTGPDGATGAVTVSARGLESAASALRDPAAGEAGKQAADQIGLALSFAEKRDGAFVWRFEVNGDAVSVNGRPLSGGGSSSGARPEPLKGTPPATPNAPSKKVDAGKTPSKTIAGKSVPADAEDDDDADEDEPTKAGTSVKGLSTKK
ncbi:MAG: hypothetical protein LWW93_09540 [Hyphomicrobiales bacterium]|nr:hypothetical protein [Hyphomicrobiales bacterium]